MERHESDDLRNEVTDNANESWWDRSLSRREANKRLAVIGAGAAFLATAGIAVGCGGEEEYDEAEVDENAKEAIEVQKADGWNVGAETAALSFTNASATDSRNSMDGWKTYTTPDALRAAWEPTVAANQKLSSPELINALSQPSLKASIQPVHSPTMDEAYARGLGMAALLAETKEPQSTAIVVDLPGPEAVAYAAALADVADVVLTFDNWPHPNAVVPSHETLGALVYYADEVKEKKAKRKGDGPTLFVMDSNRLADYSDASDRFDNRYAVILPEPTVIKANGIKTVIYATPDAQRTAELDDLNETFVLYRENDVAVTMMPLSDFRPATAAEIAELGEIKKDSIKGSGNHHSAYYYGGHPHYSPFFFSYFPMMIPMAMYNTGGMRAPANIRGRSNYTPSRRPTMFSSATRGGRAGVGRQNVSGFGRVSTRTVNGRTTVGSATRGGTSGRSGSFGRSGGRGYSG